MILTWRGRERGREGEKERGWSWRDIFSRLKQVFFLRCKFHKQIPEIILRDRDKETGKKRERETSKTGETDKQERQGKNKQRNREREKQWEKKTER